MKNVWLAVIGLAVIGYGCGPRLAETPYGQKELEWKEYVSQAYPSWEPPQTIPPVESIVPEPGQMGASSNTTYPEAQEINPPSSGTAPTPGLKPLPVDNSVAVAPALPASSMLPSASAVPTAPAIDAAPAASKAPRLDAGIPDASSSAAPVFTPSVAPKASGAKAKAHVASHVTAAAHSAAAAAPAPVAGEQTYVAKKGDTLTKIALKFYKNANKYKVIENANKDVLGKKGLRAGMKLRIPAL